MKAELDVLGVRLQIATDAEELVAPFLQVFGAFRCAVPRKPSSEEPGRRAVVIQVSDAAGTFQAAAGSRVRLAAGSLRAPHVYNLLYRSLVRALDGVYLLHAAAVAADGRAWLVSGPSGSGKTSLGRALLRRGFGFLSDDLAPLSVDDRRIHPFPRRLGIELGSLSGDQTGLGIRLGDKRFVGADELDIAVVDEALPPGAVVLMNPYDIGDDAPVRMTLGLAGDPAALEARLQAVPGIRVHRRAATNGLQVLDLELTGSDAIGAAEAEVDRADADLLFHCRGYGATKTYGKTPAIAPLPVHEAALGLLRETLNREPRSALMRRHGGKLGAALFELTGLLAGVPCYELRPGGIEATADLLATTFRRPARR